MFLGKCCGMTYIYIYIVRRQRFNIHVFMDVKFILNRSRSFVIPVVLNKLIRVELIFWSKTICLFVVRVEFILKT